MTDTQTTTAVTHAAQVLLDEFLESGEVLHIHLRELAIAVNDLNLAVAGPSIGLIYPEVNAKGHPLGPPEGGTNEDRPQKG